MDHVAEEEGLPGLAELGDTDVRQHFLLKDFFGVLDSLLFGHT